MANPFIDNQAFVNDGYDDDDYDSNGGEEEYAQDNQAWNDENDPEIHHEDSLANEHHSAAAPSTPRARVDTIAERLISRYVQKENPVSRPEHDTQSSQSLFEGLESSKADDDMVLKGVLHSEKRQIFHRVKCKPGSEMDLVFDIMQYSQTLYGLVPPITPSVEQSPSPTPPFSSAARALQIIREYALSQEGEPKTIADELEKLLGENWSVEWTRLIDVAGLEPGDEDVQVALANVNARAKAFLPVSILEEADRAIDTSAERSNATSTSAHDFTVPGVVDGTISVISAFCVPTVNGFVYLEGHCDATWRRWLGQRPTVVQMWIEPVDCEEIGVLLDTPVPSIQPFSWVRVKKGRYRDDVGLALSTELRGGQRHFKVLLVPRIPTRSKDEDAYTSSKGKRKRTVERPAQRLFHPSTFNGEYVKTAEEIYRSSNTEYRYGLTIKYYDGSSLTQSEVVMDYNTRRLFGLSGDPFLKMVHLPTPEDWLFFFEEPVTVIVGAPLTERQKLNPDLPQSTYHKDGIVVDVAKEHCMVQFDEYKDFNTEDTKQQVSNLNIRKRIRAGHSIEVVCGEHKGRQGLVISSSFDVVEVKESTRGSFFKTHINSCRITANRNASVVPWLDRHVAAVFGPWRGYSGIVVDVNPPNPQYTMLEVKISRLGISMLIPHDFVVDTVSKLWLRCVCPLDSSQQHYQQPTWDVYCAPNLRSPPIDPYTGQFLIPEDIIAKQPKEPWVNAEVMVIEGPIKNTGRIRRVERTREFASGLKVEVEFNFFSAEHGAVPRYWCNYASVRDPRTGLPLHIIYPLKKRQRYWEPLTRLKAVSVKNPYKPKPWQPPVLTPSTLLWNLDVADIFSTPEAAPSGSGGILPPSHWAMDSRLDQKSFSACWKPSSGSGIPKVTATPHCRMGKVYLRDGASGWYVPPEEVHDLALCIKPTTVKESLLVVRGPHAGTNIRPVFCKYIRNREEPLIIGAVYEHWGTSVEKYMEREIEVEAENCAFAASDPNKDKFKTEVKALRDKFREPQEGKKTRRRAIKPRGG
ncbi:Transcription elongation factor SPT5 [Stygiomarasmius scandens]|uniref:Transcription elongation factor SPT5 n=1 Tax=Marasmiellus scandens TaxID=2682957 RepID=A0ABR1IWR8_9AGAR